MVHEHAVLSLDFTGSKERLLLASGDAKGLLKVWKISNGKCLRQIAVCNSAVTCVRFTS